MNDVIYRQDAINAIITEGRTVDSRYLGSERILHESDAVEAISMLPSAEPEIIRCKDCKNYYSDEDGRGYHCERDSNVRFSVHKDFYCADAERRTDERLDIQTECD